MNGRQAGPRAFQVLGRWTRRSAHRSTLLVAVVLLGMLTVSSGALASGAPKLDKVGIVCGTGGGKHVCQMFVVATGARELVVQVGNERVTTNRGYGGFPPPYIVVPTEQDLASLVQGKRCVKVQVVATNKRGSDRGKTRLCDVGRAGIETFQVERQYLKADYKPL